MGVFRKLGLLSCVCIATVMPIDAYACSEWHEDDDASVESQKSALVSESYNLEMPQEQREGAIAYITGGVGSEEREYLESQRAKYNLRVLSASKVGDFQGDTNIVLYDNKGAVLLSAEIGPIFYANLPKGAYTLIARDGDKKITKQLRIGKSQQNTVLSW